MKKIIFKQATAFLMAVILVVSVIGCGKEKGKEASKNKHQSVGNEVDGKRKTDKADEEIYEQMLYEEKSFSDMIYTGKDFVVSGMNANVDDFSVQNDKLYFKAFDADRNIKYFTSELDGSGLMEINISGLNDSESIYSLLADKDNGFTFLTHYMKEKDECLRFIKTDGTGSVTFEKDITEEMALADESITKTMLDGKGRLIAVTPHSVIAFDKNGSLLGKIKSDNYLEGSAVTKDGELVCGYIGEKGAMVQLLDIDKQKWGKKYKLNISSFPNTDALVNGLDYDFYYRDDNGICGFHFSDKKTERLMDYMASSLTSSETWCIYPIGEDKMLGTAYNEQDNVKLVLYSKIDPAAYADKKIITFATLYATSLVEEAAAEFNKKNTGYQIVFREYENLADPEMRMTADIVAGNIPDIIDLTYCSVDQYAAKGILEDLTPYFDKESEVSTEDIIPSVLNVMKTGDKLYYVAPDFALNTLIARTEDIGGAKSGWNFDEMNTVINKKRDGVNPFFYASEQEILDSIFADTILDFVDWHTGKCDFENQDFKEILKVCKNSAGKESEDMHLFDKMKNRQILFQSWMLMPEDLQGFHNLCNADVCPIGYPCEDKKGSYFDFTLMLGMSAKSEVKEGVWEFLSFLISKEFYGNHRSSVDWIPVRKDCFEMIMRERTTTESYVDEFGKYVEPRHTEEGGWYGQGVEDEPISKEDEMIFRKLIENTNKKSNYNPVIMQIVKEEAQAYFAGDKSVDETAKIIQNRVTTYVNENR